MASRAIPAVTSTEPGSRSVPARRLMFVTSAWPWPSRATSNSPPPCGMLVGASVVTLVSLTGCSAVVLPARTAHAGRDSSLWAVLGWVTGRPPGPQPRAARLRSQLQARKRARRPGRGTHSRRSGRGRRWRFPRELRGLSGPRSAGRCRGDPELGTLGRTRTAGRRSPARVCGTGTVCRRRSRPHVLWAAGPSPWKWISWSISAL